MKNAKKCFCLNNISRILSCSEVAGEARGCLTWRIYLRIVYLVVHTNSQIRAGYLSSAGKMAYRRAILNTAIERNSSVSNITGCSSMQFPFEILVHGNLAVEHLSGKWMILGSIPASDVNLWIRSGQFEISILFSSIVSVNLQTTSSPFATFVLK